MRLRRSPRPPDHNLICKDCGTRCPEDYGIYMVTDEVWLKAGLLYRENACMPCLEKRIARPLVADDFTNCPANWYTVPQFFPAERVAKWTEEQRTKPMSESSQK